MLEYKKNDAALNITARHITQNKIIISDYTNQHQFSSFPSNGGTNSPGPQMEN